MICSNAGFPMNVRIVLSVSNCHKNQVNLLQLKLFITRATNIQTSDVIAGQWNLGSTVQHVGLYEQNN